MGNSNIINGWHGQTLKGDGHDSFAIHRLFVATLLCSVTTPPIVSITMYSDTPEIITARRSEYHTAQLLKSDERLYAVYVLAVMFPPVPVQFVWKNSPRGLSRRSYVCAPK